MQPSAAANLGRYWQFFWPLALGALFLLAGQQAYNGVLARSGDPGRELAVYACAAGIFFVFDIGTAFMPNMVTVYARSAQARARVFRFCATVGVLFMLPVLAIGSSAMGATMLRAMYSLDASMLADVQSYLVLLSGLILLHTLQHYHNGLLILEERSSWRRPSGRAGHSNCWRSTPSRAGCAPHGLIRITRWSRRAGASSSRSSGRCASPA